MPEEEVNARSVNMFKIRLDKHWENQEVQYNYRATLTTADTDIGRGKHELENQ